ncbi:hypothetical protein TNCV_2068121 [Trichonephila clavipes]|uniref:Uncharacterized protein n=1 Tax=Trichonephila clavipes TaxID=2585209 RepID=A0A8X6W3N8_TRICX|nr:hypothetical protein TNCV_2068121 [Trichonephila clavipes]
MNNSVREGDAPPFSEARSTCVEPWQWKRRKKRNRFEQTSRTLQRKISMRSTKDQLVEKECSYAGETQCFPVEPSDVEEMPPHDGETV